MKNLKDYPSEASSWAGRRCREAKRRARAPGNEPSRWDLPNVWGVNGNSPFFYTENCPEGIYLTGILTDTGIESAKGGELPNLSPWHGERKS